MKGTRVIKFVSFVVIAAVAIIAVLIYMWNGLLAPGHDYKEAIALYDKGNYSDAKIAFEELGTYRDSEKYYQDCINAENLVAYSKATGLMSAGNYEDAQILFQELGEYSDSKEQVVNCQNAIKDKQYQVGLKYLESADYAEALVIFSELGNYSDSEKHLKECQDGIRDEEYAEALELFEDEKYAEAKVRFEALNGYKDSVEHIALCEAKMNEQIVELPVTNEETAIHNSHSNDNENSDLVDVVDLFQSIEYDISLKKLCAAIGSDNYEKGATSYRSGTASCAYSFGFEYALNGIPGEVSFRFECESEHGKENMEQDGKLVSMNWSAIGVDEIYGGTYGGEYNTYEMYLAVRDALMKYMGTPTEESSGKNNYGETYAYYTYWGDFQLAYSTALEPNLYAGRNHIWAN